MFRCSRNSHSQRIQLNRGADAYKMCSGVSRLVPGMLSGQKMEIVQIELLVVCGLCVCVWSIRVRCDSRATRSPHKFAPSKCHSRTAYTAYTSSAYCKYRPLIKSTIFFSLSSLPKYGISVPINAKRFVDNVMILISCSTPNGIQSNLRWEHFHTDIRVVYLSNQLSKYILRSQCQLLRIEESRAK